MNKFLIILLTIAGSGFILLVIGIVLWMNMTPGRYHVCYWKTKEKVDLVYGTVGEKNRIAETDCFRGIDYNNIVYMSIWKMFLFGLSSLDFSN